jgi:hypothetical protein
MNYRQPKDVELSKEGGFLLQQNNSDFEEYFHGFEDIREMNTKQLVVDEWSPCEG